MEEKLLSVKEAIRKLNISESTLRLWTKKGKVKSYRNYRGFRMIPFSEINRINELRNMKYIKETKSGS